MAGRTLKKQNFFLDKTKKTGYLFDTVAPTARNGVENAGWDIRGLPSKVERMLRRIERSSFGKRAERNFMHRIFYFSGTGNTLAAAKRIGALLGETELISIAGLQRGNNVELGNAETIGIFHPVYCFGIPTLVMRFLERIRKPEGNQPYVYSLATSGGMLGSAHLIMEQLLAKQHIRLNAFFHVPMPTNYIPLSPAPSPVRARKILEKAEKKLTSCAGKIAARKNHRPIHVFPLDMIGEMVAKRAVSSLDDYDKYFWLTENCDSCGLCEKICPASNIIMMNGMPTWRGHCEQCMACLQWCPKQAIQFKQVTLKRKRYHHPDIHAEELFRNKP